MNNTPLQELILFIEKEKSEIENQYLHSDHQEDLLDTHSVAHLMLSMLLSKAKELLPKEKEVIKQAYIGSHSKHPMLAGIFKEQAEDYFNETFNNEESHK